MDKHFYITTPIYYVNDKPHIGHAYTSIACDIIARFKRNDGYIVRFLTGTDEYGQKVEKSAFANNIPPQKFTDLISKEFRDLTKTLNISNDGFIRTTEKRHIKTVQNFWNKLMNNGFIYKDIYEGWYSIRDECFYNDDEIIDGFAPTGAKVEWHKEESYFFKLSLFQEKLLEFYENNPNFIQPESRRNEVISFVKGGSQLEKGALKDLSISRTSFSWGVKVPNDPKHIIYVWLDALTNYLSNIGFVDNDPLYQQFWENKNPDDINHNDINYDAITDSHNATDNHHESNQKNTLNTPLHVVGKDILRFHAVYWPAFLMAAEIPLPKTIFAHGWWKNEGQKISKSLKNTIDPTQLVKDFGLDQLRYFLFREVPFGQDGNFSQSSFITRINTELANKLGNLVQRNMTMIYKNCQKQIPMITDLKAEDKLLIDKSYTTLDTVRNHLNKLQFHIALDEIFILIDQANKYFDSQAPWELKKLDVERMQNVLYTTTEVIRVIAILLNPFIPEITEKIFTQLNLQYSQLLNQYVNKNHMLKSGSGTEIPKPEPIIPRVES